MSSPSEGRAIDEFGRPRDGFPMRTCRDAVLDAFSRLEQRHGRRDFQLDEIVAETVAYDPQYKKSTVRTHVTSRMCVDAPEHHASVYGDLTRVDRGIYRRR